MIRDLTIRNFLSHKNTRLQFDKGVNVFVGQSYAGKSSVIQAIRWLINNRPSGDSFRSFWGGTTKVSMTTTEGDRVQRIKSNKLNEYRINDKEPYRAFGTDVPDDVKKTLNFGEINLATQFEPHFLISRSSGEIAQYFNRIAGLDQIDEGVKNVNKWIRQIQSEKEADEKEKVRKQEDLKQYEDLDEIEAKVKKLEKFEQKKEDYDKEIENIAHYIETIETLDREIENIEKKIEAEDKVNEIIELYQKRDSIAADIEELYEYRDTIEVVEKEIEDNSKKVKAESKINEITDLIDRRDEIESSVSDLYKLKYDIEKIGSDIEATENKLNELEEEFHENYSGVCPLCEGSGEI
jgi:DNA repair exonuclease SbcCD ATPase subunit